MITIHGELYSSKNSRTAIITKSGRNIVLKSKSAHHQAEVDFPYQLSANRAKFKAMSVGKPFPWRIQFMIYRRTDGRFDFVNIVQGLLDGMVRSGLIPDDDAKHVIPVFVPYAKDSDHPRTEITVL